MPIKEGGVQMAKRCLLVDDSPLIHTLLRRTLEKYNYEVCGDAMNGRDGVDLFGKLHPDIVFMDINMPIMDGISAATEIKKADPQAQIIMLSALDDEHVIKNAKELGINIFLKKPFTDYMIISSISKL
jgi:two-component system, chemotaxis family, chemotaxis protein CheY